MYLVPFDSIGYEESGDRGVFIVERSMWPCPPLLDNN